MHQPRVKVRRLLFLLAVGAVVLSSTEVAEAQCGGSTSQQQQQQQDGSGTPSKQNKLAMYKVSLKTYWSRARFPRHYPEWKPPAQFGKLVGRTHDPSYVLYRLGQRLTPGARQYVETGNTDGLDVGVGKPNTLHAFVGPAVPQGEGSSTARAFLDGNHTLISVFARINPSPDWFVGVDSFQLCVESNWVDTVTIELDPLDGGTDNGLTFTAANWPTQPQGIAYRITSRFPAHPAGSFYYPNLPRLPPIATLTFTKLREYTLTETYHEDNVEMEFVNSGNYDYPPTPREIDPNRSLNEAIAEERREMLDNKKYRYWTSSKEPATTQPLLDSKAAIINSIVTSYASQKQQQLLQGSSSTSEPAIRSDPGGSSGSGATAGQKQPAKSWQFYQPSYEALQKARILEDVHRKIINGTAAGASSGVATSSSSSYPGNTIDSWKNATSKPIDYQQIYRAKQQHHRLYTKRKHSKTRPARDCKVSEWGAWSACSRSCGVGETQRTRKILLKPRRGGQPCPPLKKTKWCGSINPCPENNPHLDNLDNHDDLDSPAPHPWWSR